MKIFVDTQILIYAMDNFDSQKKEKSRALLKELANSNKGVISTQILQEFYKLVTEKISVDSLITKSFLRFFNNFEVINITPILINEAIDCSILNQISFDKSLKLVTAETAKCEYFYTESLESDKIIRGVTIKNPFEKECV
jgi:predicted nucleic acid-binding protein